MRLSKSAFSTSLLFGSAFLSAVFYQGFYTEFLCLSLALLISWGIYAAWLSHEGTSFPKTIVVLCLMLYWIWLAVSASWGRVGYLGTINFWWLGSFPLVFWIYTVSPQRDQLWRLGFQWAAVVGVALALGAISQWLIYDLEPTATFLNRNSLAALLNIIVMPLCGYFLLSDAGESKRHRWFYAAAIFILAFGLGIIEGRGAIIAAGLSFLILIGVAWNRVSRRTIVVLVSIVLAAFLVASLVGKIGVGQRLETVVSNPYEAGSTRFVIWRQSWEMVKESPWMGVGLGHYNLYWPPYRDPSDNSAGQFVHNDYLQIWIEAGLPGLLLLLAVLVSVLIAYISAMRNRKITSAHKIEITALFAGLFAVAMHSFVDFNLYILSILILAGLMLGRFHALAFAGSSVGVIVFRPSKVMTERGYRMLTVLIGGLILLYCATLGLSSFEYRRGLRLAEASQWEEAYSAFERAGRYFPYADNVQTSRADLLRHMISVLPESKAEEKKAMFEEAERTLARAEELNPLRPQVFATRAVLYENNPRLIQAKWFEDTVQNYRHAIELDPSAHQPRFLYASFLVKQGRHVEAKRILEDGMKYDSRNRFMLPYYALTATLRADAGDREGASELNRRIEEIRKRARKAPVP